MYKIISVALLSGLIMPNVHAAEWSLSGSINPSLKYDDNIFMRDENKLADYQSSMSPTLTGAYKLENTQTSVSAGYVIDRYEASQQLDQENPFVRLDTQYQTERSNWGLGLGYTENSSRSEAEADTGTGNFETNSTVTTKSISPNYSFKVTELDSLSINVNYTDRAYSTTDFSNSKSRSLSTSWQHQFTERLNGGLSLSASNNKSDGLDLQTDDDTYNLSLISKYDLSEVWTIDGSVGVRRLNSRQTDAFGFVDKNTSSGVTLSFNVSYKHEVDTASLGLSRSVSPSSTGDVNEQDKLSLSWSRQLSERFSTSINGSIQSTRSASDNSSDKRDYINISPAVNWKMSPDTIISLSYNYRQQKESEANTNASSNSVMLTLNYNWDGFTASR
tara:strand:- start:28448 stop:29614 length:1167 start_codon:yes stop_codon:yes gene_type:complete